MAILEGNVYVNKEYTSQEAIDALGGTSSITGEALTFGVNAFAEGGTTSNVPIEGGTIFYQDIDRLGSSIYNDGTYDGVFLNTRSNYLYAVPKKAGSSSSSNDYMRDIKIYVDGGTHQHITLLGRSNYVNLMGNLSFTAKNADLGQDNQNMGGGDSTDDSHCSIIGNVSFDISNCQSGGSFYVHYGNIGSAEQKVKITGKVVNFTLNRTDNNSPTFRGVRTGDNYGVWADYTLTVSSSWFKGSLEMGYATDNSTWEGSFVMNVSATTAANIYAFERASMSGLQGEHTFTLNVLASDAATETAGTVGNFNTINVAAGATLKAGTVNDASDLNIAIGGLVVAPTLSNIGCINVTGEFVQADTLILSGLSKEAGSDLGVTIMYGDQEITKGKFGGQYEILAGGDLVIHNPSNITFLVNSNYTDGAVTDVGVKGYSSLAAAQAAVTNKEKTTLMISTMDTNVDASDFTEALVTKDYVTVLDGADGSALDLQGQDLVIGDSAADTENTSVSVSYTNNINSVKFGNVTGKASVAISKAEGLGSIDLTGAAIANAQINVNGSVIGDVKLADNAATAGKITISDSTITNVYGGAADLEADLTGKNEIENVYAENQGSKIKLAGSHVVTYTAGLSESGAAIDTLTYNDGVTADTLIIGGNANQIGKIEATVTGGGADELIVGGEGDTISGDIDLTLAGGKFASIEIATNATVGGAINVNLAGGTNAPMQNGQVLSGANDVDDSFPGIVYGASVTGTLDGGEKGTKRTLNVLGNAKVVAIQNFDELNVTGGTLNVAGGSGHDSEIGAGNTLEISGNILNKRAINAGSITAVNFDNFGLVGTKRDADSFNDVTLDLSGDLNNAGYIKTSAAKIGGAFTNSGKITATGDISVSGAMNNSGELFIRSVFSRDGVFTQDGALTLSGVDFVNTGFVSVGKLTGVNNLTTSKMYVTGGAEITGNITINAGAEVAFTNKADDSVTNGLTLGGKITMYDTSTLVVSGDLNTTGTKTITVNVGDLIGSNEIVRAEGGVNAWTINLAGAKAGLYEYVKTETSVVIYSLDQLFVNSAFSADADIVVDGNKLVFGKNAFASVADAVAAAKSGAKIIIAGDKTGMDVAAAGFDVVLDDAIVGDVTADAVFVTSDSKVNSIASATSLLIDAGAVLSVTETIPTSMHIVIDAEKGSGARLVLDVDSEKVHLDLSNVVVIAPAGKAEQYQARILEAAGETVPAHVGDLYLVTSDYAYFRKDTTAFIDGDVFDKATGDALFAGVNAFTDRAQAEAAAQASGGVLVIVGFNTSDKQHGSPNITTMFELASGGSSGLYGTGDNPYLSDADHTTIVKGTDISTTAYGLNKGYVTSGNFTFIVEDSVMSGTVNITGNTHANVMNGNVNATITNSRLGSTYIGYGSFGTDENKPIDINVTVKASTIGAFYGIQTQPNNTNPENKQFINANIDIKIYDSVVGGTFTVLNTNNQHWNGRGATLLQTYFSSGSINVEVGGSRITDNIRTGLSLELAGKSPQAFNVSNTLHIVATDNSTVTTASYLCEWDTIIIDATANLQLNTLQYSTTAVYTNGQTDNVLDGRNTLTQVMINMSGYKSGTHQVVKASGSIYTDANLSNITVIGDNDLTGQCQLAYTFANAEETTLNGIYVFDKTDDMYVNTGFDATVSGTTVNGQELLFGYNAHTDFDKALFYANDWHGSIVVTGGIFESQDFEGNNVVLNGGNIGAITMGSAKAGTLTVGKDGAFGTADGSGTATVDIDSNATLGDIANFTTVKFAADAEITGGNLNFSGSSFVIDVDDFIGSSHVVLTADAITGFDASKVSFVGKDFDKYSMIQDGNTLILKSAIQSNTYVNSEYTAEITGTILPDGTYLEYGFNAFSTLAEGVAALGSDANTLTVTGGSYEDTFELTKGNLALLDGVVIDGVVAGNGKNSITVDGNVTLGGIEAVSNITITTSSFLSADYIDLGAGGTIYVTGTLGSGKVGNLTKIISTAAGISGATLTGDEGFTIYAQGNDVYLLDKTRIYVDPTFTDAVTGTTVANGDTLIFGVNAFAIPANTNLANATELNDALVSGGTLFISNWGTASSQQAGDVRPLKDVSIVAEGPAFFSIVYGNNGGGGHVVDGDVTITVQNDHTSQAGTAFFHSNSDDARWTFNGNVTVNFIGKGTVNSNDGFAITKRARFGENATLTVNIVDKELNTDFTPFRYANNGNFDSMKKVTVNLTNVYGSADRWLRLFSNGDGKGDNFTGTSLNAKDVELNITNTYLHADNQNWSVALTNGAEGSRNTNFTVHLSGATVDGLISGVRNRDQNSPGNGSVYNGNRTVYVDGGANQLARLIMINHLVVDANSSLVLTDRQGSYGNNVAYALHFLESNPSGQNSITIDVSGYTGADKMLVSAPRMGIAQRALSQDDVELKLVGDTEGKFAMGLGLTKGAFIITKNGDVIYNAQFSTADNGTAFGDSFLLVDHEDANAFNKFEDAKTAFDAHEAINPGRTLFVSGNGDQTQAFYADGYAVSIVGGTYDEIYGTDDENATVASVNMKITDGQFFKLEVSDGTGEVTGDARIEIAGGKFGVPATYTKPTDPEEVPEIDEPAVPATINGSKDNVGGTSTLVISKDLVADTVKDDETIVNADITGSVTGFDSVEIGKDIANMVISEGLSAGSITIDASSKLTVLGDLEAATITIDATAYDGPTKTIAVSGSFETEKPAVTILGDLETYDYRYVEDTLYLVSKNAGNVYLNSTWDESISGTIYNGELLVWGVNALNSMDEALLKITSDYTLFITGGVFNGDYTFADNSKIDIRDSGVTIGSLVLGDGTTVKIAGVTSGSSSIGAIAAAEGSTAGYSISAANQTAFTTIDGIRSFTFGAGQGITVTGINFRENGGSLTVDLSGYTQTADKVSILTTTDGINNFIQHGVEYVEVDGETVAQPLPSKTVIGEVNSDHTVALYYDEDSKSVVSVKLTQAGYLRRDANADENGTVVDGTTLVYGYNLHDGDPGVVAPHIISGGTLFAEGGSYWFFCGAPVNAQLINVTANGCVIGYENSDQYHPATYQKPGKTREGDFTFYADGSTITWYAAFAGRGIADSHQTLIVANRVYDDPEDPESGFHYEDGVYNLTLKNGTHTCNDFFVADYANVSGGTVNVTFEDYRMAGDLKLFSHVYRNDGEGLKEVNLVLTNITAPEAKWLWMWDPREATDTKLTITITDSTFTGDNHTLGFIGGSTDGSWSGEGEITISGFTTQGRLSGARGSNDNGDNISNITGTRTLFVNGENYVRVLRHFSTIDVAKDAGVLQTAEVRLMEGSNIILRGKEGYTGPVKEFIVASSTVTGILRENAEFLTEDGSEIDGYKAGIGDKSVFIYKTTGDVYMNGNYTAAINGTTITEADGTLNYLVFGDNAVTTFANAIESVEERDDATIQIESITARDFYTKGYKVSLNGGRITNVYGGNQPTTTQVESGEVDAEGNPIMVDQTVAADSVSSADITVNSGATVSNVTMANEYSEVSGDATLTVGAGAAFVTGSTTGVLDGGKEYVGGDSNLVFLGDASARTITGFDMVTLSADGTVELLGAFDGTAITIDATEFVGSTKKVLVAEGGFGDSAITVTVKGDSSFGYQFLDDGKTLVLTTNLVSDTFVNTAWTEADVHNQFVGDTALIWGKNAFASVADAAAAVGQDATLNLDGGASTDAITLTKNNNVAVNASTVATSVGSITADGGALIVANDFVATELSGFSALNLEAGNTITVNGIAMADESAINIDVTGYTQDDVDIVVINTEAGITGLPEAITVTGENDKLFYAYYDEEGKDVHLMRVDSFYVDVAYGTNGENIQPGEVNPITGERLIFGVNAFYYLNDGLNAMKPGQNLYINGRIGNNINTRDRMGNIYITGSTVPVLINGYTSGDQVYEGDVWLTVENTQFGTENGSFLFGTVTMDQAWTHNQHILGNMTVNVIGSTIGGDTAAIRVRGMNFVNVLGTAEESATITMNFIDSIINDDMTFIGDSPLGKTETFQGVARKGANLVINFDNVNVINDKWWVIQEGDQESTGTIDVNIKDSTIGRGDGEMRFSLGDWGNDTPRCHSDITFNLENTTIVGYLQSAKMGDGNHNELTGYDGNKVINLVGSNSIRYTYWFNEINLAAGATLTGRRIRMASAGGTINVDITGYTGKSKVILSMDNAFENVSSINVTGASDEYKVLTSDRAIVIRGAVKDMYVNSTYTVETCPAGTVYNDELLFFGENAFATIDEAAPLLTEDAVLYITGGTNLLDLAAWSNSISIDATAEVNYGGSDVITIAGDLANAGLFTISAAGFGGGAADITVLTANSITGEGTFATDDDSYLIKVVNGNEVHLIQKKTDLFVDTAWKDLADGTPVTVGEAQAVIGIDAFATADAAVEALAASGSITVLGGTVNFTSAILSPVVAKDTVTVENTAIGTGTGVGSLTLESGATGTNLSVRGKGTLTVNSGAKVSGLGMLKGATVNFAAGSVLDFDISGTTAGASPSVTNFSVLAGTPDYTITLAAGQAEGEYLLAGDAASFNSVVTLFVGDTSIGVASLEAALVTTKYTYTLGITDNNELAITVSENILPDVPTLAYVNSEWTGLEDGTPVTVGTVSATIGYDAFATLSAGIAGVTDDGSIEVVGGTVSFADGYSKTITVGADATIVGNAVFTETITVDGTVAFDTQYAAEGAQFTGFSYLVGKAAYTLVPVAAAGAWTLATDAVGFESDIVCGDVTLKLGEEAVIGDFTYVVTLENASNDIVLRVTEYVPPTPTTPTHAFVSSEWAGLEDGTIVTIGDVSAKIGYDAFATLAAGIAGVTADGSVEVVGGEVSFADGYYKTITVDADATVIGTASFLNQPITINGTMAFDVALTTRTAAQFADIQFVSGDTQFTLTVDNPAVGTYMLASGLWYDANYQPVFTGVVKFGENELTVGNDITIGDFTYGLRTTGNLELMLVVDKAVAPTAEVSFINASLDGAQNMIGKIFKSETAGIDSEIKFYTLDGNAYGMNDLIEDGWTFAGVGDFNGDGMDDMLRYNNTNGLVVSDNANGNGTFTPAVLNLKNASWDILGTGDFNGDGFDDVLVANRTAASATVGLLGYWSKGTEWTLINGYSDEWTLVDTGDYDGNGSCDMLWKNSFVGEGGGTYNAYCTWRLGDLAGGIDWSIVMVAKVNETETPDTDAWSYLTTGDFNGDGISDIAMINDVGTVAVATMAADGSSSAWTVLSVVDTSSWNLAGTTDLNLDGVDDIIWCQDEVAGVGSLAGYWQINADELNHPVMTAWQNIGWLA